MMLFGLSNSWSALLSKMWKRLAVQILEEEFDAGEAGVRGSRGPGLIRIAEIGCPREKASANSDGTNLKVLSETFEGPVERRFRTVARMSERASCLSSIDP